jgi:hypothetical protein
MIVEHFHVDQAADVSLGQLVVVELKVKLPLNHWELSGLNTRQALEVRVVESLEGRGTVSGVKGQQVTEEVEGQWISVGKFCGKVLGGLGGHGVKEGPRLHVGDAVDGADTGLPHEIGDELELAHSLASREQGLASQGLSKDAAYAPNVDGVAVAAIEAAAELRRTVPPRCYVVGPVGGGGLTDEGSCQAKVTDLELAVAVGQDILGLQVPMKNSSLVDEGQSPEKLIEKDLRGTVRLA